MITAINTVTLYVSDQERARAFYVDQLGFDVCADNDMGPMGRWLEVGPAGGHTRFVLADAAGFGQNDRIGDSAGVTLTAADLTALHADLSAKGVPVTEPEAAPWGTSLQVTDPDGQVFLVKESTV